MNILRALHDRTSGRRRWNFHFYIVVAPILALRGPSGAVWVTSSEKASVLGTQFDSKQFASNLSLYCFVSHSQHATCWLTILLFFVLYGPISITNICRRCVRSWFSQSVSILWEISFYFRWSICLPEGSGLYHSIINNLPTAENLEQWAGVLCRSACLQFYFL